MASSSDSSASESHQPPLRRVPIAGPSLETVPSTAPIEPHGNIPNTPLAASCISFFLGSVFALAVLLFASGGISGSWWATYQLGFFVASWAAFHWGEFAVTAGWNREKLSVDSFLLDNGRAYHIANGTALLEFLITQFFWPGFKRYTYVSILGIAMTLFGQTLRSTAMIQASNNFSHTIATHKLATHQLVTSGVYSWFRHPSYAGFFYWGIGTQLALQNPLSFVLFSVVLWRFFNLRIRVEEYGLVKFFGDEYKDYRKRVRTMIPGIA